MVTLWSTRIFESNHKIILKNPDVIHPDQVLVILIKLEAELFHFGRSPEIGRIAAITFLLRQIDFPQDFKKHYRSILRKRKII